MNADHFLVSVDYRPRRVAFLVNVDMASDLLWDAIAEFCTLSWGGRYNPIIPVSDGIIPKDYWDLLSIVDPDIIYTYEALAPETIERIRTKLQPLDLSLHRQPPDQNDFDVAIEHQASVIPALKRLSDQFPAYARTPLPGLLMFDYKLQRNVSSFVKRNFGASTELSILCRDNEIQVVTSEPDDKAVMKILTGQSRGLVTPIQACSDVPRRTAASRGHLGIAFTLFFGASHWNFVDYWNSAQFRDSLSSTLFTSLSEMWATPELLDDREFYEHMLELIRRRTFTYNQSRKLQLVSYDQNAERMQEITHRLCVDLRWNFSASPPIVRAKGELPTFSARRVNRFPTARAERPRYEQAAGSDCLLELPQPIDAPRGRKEQWIAEFAVQDKHQEQNIANRSTWWKLPRKNGLSTLFFPETKSRIGSDRHIVVEVSGEHQGILLETPDLKKLFSRLLVSAEDPVWVRNISNGVREYLSRTYYIRSSDKGRYAQGVLGLFRSLKEASYFFEHDYWRSIIDALSTPIASPHTREKAQVEIARIIGERGNESSRVEQLVDEVLDLAGRIQRPVHYVNFGWLADRYWKYVKSVQEPDLQLHEVDCNGELPSTPNDKELRRAAYSNLRDKLGILTANRFLLPGIEIQCDHCLASLWYHVDDLRSTTICRGCRKEVNLAPETPWSYALNELVVAAVRDHGVAPVIRTAYRLFDCSRECFYFLPGLEIRDYQNETQICEFDLVWIKDGEFGVAEIKRTPKKFVLGEKLVDVLQNASPDRFLFISTSGTKEQLESVRSQAQDKLGREVCVEAWDPSDFQRSNHPGPHTVKYRIF